jgi:osmotically-inducible protein OsmY
MCCTTALTERLDHAITNSPYFNGRKLRFEAAGNSVVLSGEVDSYFQKQMAQETLRRVEGVSEIDNRLEVVWS